MDKDTQKQTNREWWDSLPKCIEFEAYNSTCWPSSPEEDDPESPGEDYVFLEFWAGPAGWFHLDEVRTWEIVPYEKRYARRMERGTA